MIGFFNLSYQASESDTFITVEFGILKGGMTQTDIDIELFATDLAALSKFLFLMLLRQIHWFAPDGDDYQINVGVQRYTFNSLLTSYSLNISIIDDSVFETTESFLVGLRFADEAPSRVILEPAQTNVEILDDDSKFTRSINEGVCHIAWSERTLR